MVHEQAMMGLKGKLLLSSSSGLFRIAKSVTHHGAILRKNCHKKTWGKLADNSGCGRAPKDNYH